MSKEIEVDGAEKKTFSQAEKNSLQSYEFTRIFADVLSDIIGNTIEDIKLCFVPPEHPQRGIFDAGWRIIFTFIENDDALMVNPTACYTKVFIGAGNEPEDIKYNNLLDEINTKHAEGKLVTLNIKGEETE